MTSSANNISYRSLIDHGLTVGLWVFSAAGSLILGLILFFLVDKSMPALKGIGMEKFFTDSAWFPSEDLYGLTPMVVGSVFVMIGAIFLAAPLGIGSAVFCRYYAPKPLSILLRRVIELLAGIPSVVFGFWALVTLVPLLQELEPPGTSLLAGVLILTLMILPTVALISDASLANLPPSYIQGAAGLGLSRFTTVSQIILPSCKSGLITSLILGAGRAVGETMAILMICGNIVQIPDSLFAPVRTLTANIALEMGFAMGEHRSALFVSGLLLMVMILFLVSLAHWIRPKEGSYGTT